MDALKYLEQCGLHVSADGESLSVGPKESITDSIRTFIRAHKQEILEQVKMAANAPECDPNKCPEKVKRNGERPPGYPPPCTRPRDWTPEQRKVVRCHFHGPTGIVLMRKPKKEGSHD